MAINYTKVNSGNDWDEQTPLSAPNLAHLEQGVKDACDGVDDIVDGTTQVGDAANADTVDGKHADTDKNGTSDQLAVYNSNGRVYDSERVGGKSGSLVAQIYSGYYSGDGTANRTISISFTPQMVYVVGADTAANYVGLGLGITGTDYGFGARPTNSTIVKQQDDDSVTTGMYLPIPTTNGFIVGYRNILYPSLNKSGVTYYYVAFG